MPTEARGNYLPEAPYLRETKTYLNYPHDHAHLITSGSEVSFTVCNNFITELLNLRTIYICVYIIYIYMNMHMHIVYACE